MKHIYIDDDSNLLGRHFAVSSNDDWVLVQLDDGADQVRLNLSPNQALRMAEMLVEHANRVA